MHDAIAALVSRDGWRAEGAAARVHYAGGGDRFAVEFYAESEHVVYWTVPSEDDDASGTAAPVPRASVPDPLRERVRGDLAAAGVDPAVERDAI